MIEQSLLLLLLLLGVGSVDAFWKGSEGFLYTARQQSSSSTTELNQAKLRFKDANQMIESLQDEDSLVVMLFTSELCGPCRLQKKELKRLWSKKESFEHQHHHTSEETTSLPLKILTIDMEKWPQVGRRFSVGKLPCLIMFQGQKDDTQRLEGLVSAEELWTHVENFAFGSRVEQPR